MDWFGTKNCLHLNEVQEAPSRVNAPVATPSVYVDERGEIHNFQIGERRLNLLHTKSGVMRSGDLHKDYQHDFVFSGAVEVWCLEKDGSTQKRVYRENQYIRIPPFVPHVFHFLEDTVLAEWWDGPFHAWFYKPYRKIVEASFTGSQRGQFRHYKVSEPVNAHTKDFIVPFGLPVAGASTTFLALVTAFAVGYLVGRRCL
jgi:hypothetical protein